MLLDDPSAALATDQALYDTYKQRRCRSRDGPVLRR